MDILYNPLTQEFSVSCDFTFDKKKKKSLFEDKIVFVFGCMLLLWHLMMIEAMMYGENSKG